MLSRRLRQGLLCGCLLLLVLHLCVLGQVGATSEEGLLFPLFPFDSLTRVDFVVATEVHLKGSVMTA